MQLAENKVALFAIKRRDGNSYDNTSFACMKGVTPNNRFLLFSRLPCVIEYIQWSAKHFEHNAPFDRAIRILKSGLGQNNETPNAVGYYTTNQTNIDIIKTAFNKATNDCAPANLKGSLMLSAVQATSRTVCGQTIDNLYGTAPTRITDIVDWAVRDVLDYKRIETHIRSHIFDEGIEDSAICLYGEESVKTIYAVEHERKKQISAYRADHAYSPFVDDLTNVYIKALYEQEDPALRNNVLYMTYRKKLIEDKVKSEEYDASNANLSKKCSKI